MDTIFARAPGKLFLLGEYAVLDGCPAIVAAVDGGVEVEARKNRVDRDVDVFLPQLGIHAKLGEHGYNAKQHQGVLAFVAACISALSPEERLRLPVGIEFKVRFHEFQQVSQKLGLGGSAALVSAVTAVLMEWCYGAGVTQERPELIYHRARAAHRLAQQGVGSGADVAASVYGGVILFEPTASESSVTRLDWPQDISLLAAYSGQAARTTALIETYHRVKRAKAAIHAEFLECSTQAVARLASALYASTEVEQTWAEAAQVLPFFAEKLGLPYLTRNLRTLLALAQEHGVTAKPSGAGGGDCAIALFSEKKKGALVQAWQASGCLPLDLQPAVPGVRCERA